MRRKVDFKKDEIFLRLNVERCRELYDTDILFDGGRNSFTQSVFIELMIRLRHLDHVLNKELANDPVIIKIRDAGAHPYLNRGIGNGIFVDFGRNFKGNWEFRNGVFEKQDDECDISFQYGSSEILAKDILKLIEMFEDKVENYENQ